MQFQAKRFFYLQAWLPCFSDDVSYHCELYDHAMPKSAAAICSPYPCLLTYYPIFAQPTWPSTHLLFLSPTLTGSIRFQDLNKYPREDQAFPVCSYYPSIQVNSTFYFAELIGLISLLLASFYYFSFEIFIHDVAISLLSPFVTPTSKNCRLCILTFPFILNKLPYFRSLVYIYYLNIIIVSEIWLNDNIYDIAINLTDYYLFHHDRAIKGYQTILVGVIFCPSSSSTDFDN